VCVRAHLFACVCVLVYVCKSACVYVCIHARVCVRLRVCVVLECHVSVCMHICRCVPACGRACECMRLSLLSRICQQESNKWHDLSLTTLGVCSCLFGSGTSKLHAMMFQTSTYMGICMRICMCICQGVYVHVIHTQHTHIRKHNTCSGAYLHLCMYMSRTHHTHIHTHTTSRVCSCLSRSLCMYASSACVNGDQYVQCWPACYP